MARPLLLSCESVSKTYGTRSLFDDLSLGLFEGDQAGLVGPNGSGKSTLLKILAGVTTPDGEDLEESGFAGAVDRKSTRLNSSHSQISYAVFCLKKKKSP